MNLLKSPITYIVIGFVGLIVACLATAAIMFPSWYGAPQNAAEFGDMFGGVNALFSGLAFLGVVVAILLQRSELQLQRRELQYTRNELSGQREQLEIQNRTSRIQAFNSTFFHMLSLHNEIVSGMDASQCTITQSVVLKIEGRDCFRAFHSDLEFYSRDENDPSPSWSTGYCMLYEQHERLLGHYFRNLFHLIEFVDSDEFVDCRFYTNIVRAQLSSYEIILLYYNGVGQHGKWKFKPLIEKYGLLKNIPNSQDYESRGLYLESAFAGRVIAT